MIKEEPEGWRTTNPPLIIATVQAHTPNSLGSSLMIIYINKLHNYYYKFIYLFIFFGKGEPL